MENESFKQEGFCSKCHGLLTGGALVLFVCLQIYFSSDVGGSDVPSSLPTFNLEEITSRLTQNPPYLNATLTTKEASSSFGACLLTMEDNHLLYEWLAYHYTLLPLSYVVIGNDRNNMQDPRDVLSLWDDVPDIRYWIVNASDFDRYPDKNPKANSSPKQIAHSALVNRQKGFITTCLSRLKQENVRWVVLSDTDEYFVLHRLTNDDTPATPHLSNRSYHVRSRFPPPDESDNTTIADILETFDKKKNLEIGPCYVLPRLLVGALENRTCADHYGQNVSPDSTELRRHLLTLRFVQHAPKGEFEYSKYGKPLLDLHRIDNDTLHSKPKSIHRPFKNLCPFAFSHFPDSLFYLNHYIGTWEQYSSRKDARRNRDEWEKRAYVDTPTNGSTCDQSIHWWVPRFFGKVGRKKGRKLLGLHEA